MPSIGQNLQPFTDNGDVTHMSEKFSGGKKHQTNKSIHLESKQVTYLCLRNKLYPVQNGLQIHIILQNVVRHAGQYLKSFQSSTV